MMMGIMDGSTTAESTLLLMPMAVRVTGTESTGFKLFIGYLLKNKIG
jgi:hypothetical protein